MHSVSYTSKNEWLQSVMERGRSDENNRGYRFDADYDNAPPDASQRFCLAVLLLQNVKDYELARSSKNHGSKAEV